MPKILIPISNRVIVRGTPFPSWVGPEDVKEVADLRAGLYAICWGFLRLLAERSGRDSFRLGLWTANVMYNAKDLKDSVDKVAPRSDWKAVII